MHNTKGTFVITGANLVSQFLQSPYTKNYKGFSAVRNPAAADTLMKILAVPSNANDHEIIAVDFSALASVRAVAKDFTQRVVCLAQFPTFVFESSMRNTACQRHEKHR